jgi:hypothetical protein
LLKHRDLGGVGDPEERALGGLHYMLSCSARKMARLPLRGSMQNTRVCAVSHVSAGFAILCLAFSFIFAGCRSAARERGLLMKGEEIQAEMIQLLKQQTEAVEKEVFGGLTDTEEQEYGERKERISELQTKLHIKPAV